VNFSFFKDVSAQFSHCSGTRCEPPTQRNFRLRCPTALHSRLKVFRASYNHVIIPSQHQSHCGQIGHTCRACEPAQTVRTYVSWTRTTTGRKKLTKSLELAVPPPEFPSMATWLLAMSKSADKRRDANQWGYEKKERVSTGLKTDPESCKWQVSGAEGGGGSDRERATSSLVQVDGDARAGMTRGRRHRRITGRARIGGRGMRRMDEACCCCRR
jgi:hypothetical protein